jgi:glycerol-3-phosphate cytidylyltransferase-like family protein
MFKTLCIWCILQGLGHTDSEYDMDDIFVEQARLKKSIGKVQSRERSQAIREHRMIDKVLENCNWCFDSKKMLKHLVVAIGSKAS